MISPAGLWSRRAGVGLLLALGVALTACNNSTATPAAYFDALVAETERYSDAVESLRRTYADELAAELATLQERSDFSDTSAVASYFDQAREVAIVKTADLFSNSANELRSLIDALGELEPPEGLEDSHEDAVSSGEELVAAMPIAIEAVRNLDAIEQLDTTLQDTPYTVAALRFDLACENLEGAAAAQGIEIDLECPPGQTEESTE